MFKQCALFCAVFLVARDASAETCNYTGGLSGTSTNYALVANWDCGHVPTATDQVVINGHQAGANGALTLADVTVINGSLTTGGGDLYVTTLRVSGMSYSPSTFHVSGTATFDLTQDNFGGALFLDAGSATTISTTGIMPSIQNSGTVTLVNGNITNLINKGVFTVEQGSIGTLANEAAATFIKTTNGLVSTGSVYNFGSIDVVEGPWASVYASAVYTQKSGELHLGGVRMDLDNGFVIEAGTVTGSGVLGGNFELKGGSIAPGGIGAIGTIAIGPPQDRSSPARGTYTQQNAGIVRIDRQGRIPGVGYDQIVVADTYAVQNGGTLQVDDIGGFIADSNDAFHILTATRTSGGAFTTAKIGDMAVVPSYLAQGIFLGGTTPTDGFAAGDFFFGQNTSFLRASSAGLVQGYFPPDVSSTIYGGAPCTDAAGNVYIPRPGANAVAKYSPTGVLLSDHFYAGASNPARPVTCVVNSAGLVHLVTDGGVVLQLDANGSVVRTSSPIANLSAAATLLPNDCTLVFANDFIRGYDLCNDSPVTTYESLTLAGCGWVAAHPDGQVFTACSTHAATDGVYRISSEGGVARDYLASDLGLGSLAAGELKNLAIDPSGSSFWVGVSRLPSVGPSPLVQVSIETGNVMTQRTMPSTTSAAMIIYGAVEQTAPTGMTGPTDTTPGEMMPGEMTSELPMDESPQQQDSKKSGCNGVSDVSWLIVWLCVLAQRRARKTGYQGSSSAPS